MLKTSIARMLCSQFNQTLTRKLYFIVMFALKFKSFEITSFTLFNFCLLQVIKHLWSKRQMCNLFKDIIFNLYIFITRNIVYKNYSTF